MSGPIPLRRHFRAGTCRLLLVPVLAFGLAVAALPAGTGNPTVQGVHGSGGATADATAAVLKVYGRRPR